MAKVIATHEIHTDYSKSRDEWLANEKAEIAKVRAYAKKTGTGKLVGEEIKFSIADGYAHYMVANEKPLKLIHLGIGDSYSIPAAHARGLNLADVRDLVKRERAFAKMFA